MDFTYRLYIGASPEEVWRLFVGPEGVRQIFYGCELRSTFEPGAELAYVGPGAAGEETVHVYGRVLAYEPNRKFSFTEHPGPSYYANHAELESRVTVTLEPVGSCTKLTLVNDRWTDNHPSRPRVEDNWASVLSNLKTLAETGKTLDFGG